MYAHVCTYWIDEFVLCYFRVVRTSPSYISVLKYKLFDGCTFSVGQNWHLWCELRFHLLFSFLLENPLCIQHQRCIFVIRTWAKFILVGQWCSLVIDASIQLSYFLLLSINSLWVFLLMFSFIWPINWVIWEPYWKWDVIYMLFSRNDFVQSWMNVRRL